MIDIDLLILDVQNRNPRLLYLLLSLFTGLPLVLNGQILDDSTQLVYGPKTISYIRESGIYYQSGQEYPLDTLIRNFYRSLPVEQSGYRLQNLENTGTAQAPVFYTLPEQIGARAGFDVYDYWFNEPGEIRYYNTKSPYTRLYYTQGGNGRSWVDVTHSRNVTPGWNVGMDFRRMTAEQQIAPSPRVNERNQVTSTAYDLFSRYHSKNDRYQLLTNFSRLKHTAKESGGILLNQDPPEDITSIIAYEDSQKQLANARSSELRINYHLFHQYKLVNALKLYHILDRDKRTDAYEDQAPAAEYYRVSFPANYTLLAENFETKTFQNQVGVMGAYKAGQWNAYVKQRAVRFYPSPTEEYKKNELGIGGYLALQPDTLRTLRLEAELRSEGQYFFEALAHNRWISLRYQRSKYKPAFIYQYRNTILDKWDNDFQDPVVDRLEGHLSLQLGPLRLQPGLTLANIQNPLYFRANAANNEFSGVQHPPFSFDALNGTSRILGIQPLQGAAAQTISPQLRYMLRLGKYVFWEGDVVYTQVTGRAAEAYQVPDWLMNSSIYFEGPLFGGNMLAQLGVDVHWKSAYYANAYDPALRQFIVQQEFLVPSYPLANLFFGFKINHTRIFARMSHLNQGFTDAGYFTAPYYNGLERTFDLGIDWLFFD